MNDVIKAALVDWRLHPPLNEKALFSTAWSQLVRGTKCLVRRDSGEYSTFEYMSQDRERIYTKHGSIMKNVIEALWVVGLPPDPFDPLRKKVNDVLMEALYSGDFLRTSGSVRALADRIVDEVLMTDNSVPGVKASDRFLAISEALSEAGRQPRSDDFWANVFLRALRKRGWTVVEDV